MFEANDPGDSSLSERPVQRPCGSKEPGRPPLQMTTEADNGAAGKGSFLPLKQREVMGMSYRKQHAIPILSLDPLRATMPQGGYGWGSVRLPGSAVQVECPEGSILKPSGCLLSDISLLAEVCSPA